MKVAVPKVTLAKQNHYNCYSEKVRVELVYLQRACSLVVIDLCPTSKGSQFESGC